MPRLAKRFTVIATDLRGVSGSTSTQGSYDAANMAEDVYQLVLTLKLELLYIVGHDIGGMVAYAFLRRYPEHPWGDDSRSSNSWNLNFGKFTQSEVAHSVQSYATSEQLHSAFEMYRAFPANVQFNKTQRDRNEVPLFLAGGAGSPFAKLVPKIAEGLRASGLIRVQTELITDSIHYVVADQPEA